MWTRSTALALSAPQCATCRGSGLLIRVPCSCVGRRIFRICHEHYRLVGEPLLKGGRVRLAAGCFGRPHEEYRADFLLTAERALDGPARRIFDLYFVREWPWRSCSARCGMDRGSFWHVVYRIENRMGRALVERGLWPITDYYSVPKGVARRSRPTPPAPKGF